ncbi:MAG TPA: serine/threonine-protein kinase, partial [Gemmataceae bacterium]|nr:serine/threonine-protein kinase [Gemmataceae bacterium]
MTQAETESSDRDRRWSEVFVACLEAMDRGEVLDATVWLGRYPEFAPELTRFFADQDAVDRLAAPLRQVALGRLSQSIQTDSAILLEGGQLGDFRLIREVGRGGMGIVYEAEQISLGRRVALKLLPFAATLDPKQLQRFKNEAQAAAHLHHTNIVPVHAVGCERGVHYYAMQFIEGQTLAAVIQQWRGTRGEGQGTRGEEPRGAEGGAATVDEVRGRHETLPEGLRFTSPITRHSPLATLHLFFRTVAQFGVQAAEALEHAHQLGVVHRDIKPANLLVDVRGTLWITDFGLAHFQNQDGLTMTGDLVGTLRYMSPEQALAKRALVDHRTDIYSLGVTLYELMTLEPAFSGRDREELLWQIAFEEPRPLRQLNKSIPLELETIVLKAIEKNPAERYATAQELADDLERFLGDKPIQARRPTLLHRARKWSRRHRAVVAATAVSLVLLLVLAVVGLAVNNVMIERERQETKKEKDKAQEEKERTRENLQLALQALDKIYVKAVEEGAPRDPQRAKEYRQLLQDGLQFYEAFAEKNSANPDVGGETGLAYLRVANIEYRLGHFRESARACEKAFPLFEKLKEDFPDNPDYLQDFATCHATRGRALMSLRQNTEAETALRRALELQATLAAKFSDLPRHRLNLGKTQNALSTLLEDLSRFDEAAAMIEDALKTFQLLVERFPEMDDHYRELANAYTNQGSLLRSKAQYPQSLESLRECLKIREMLAAKPGALPEDRRLLAAVHYNLGPVLRSLRRYQDAQKAYEQAID